MALPKDSEEVEPSFQHRARNELPEIGQGSVRMRLIAGSAYGETSPVKTLSPMFYLDATMPAGSRFTLPAEYQDRALYPVDAAVSVNGVTCAAQSLAVLASGIEVGIAAHEATRLILLGGQPLDGARIEAAKRDWAEGRFPKVPGDDHEFIPLPQSTRS